MIIKRIGIKAFGNIDRLELNFDPVVTMITGEYADTIIQAIGVLLRCENRIPNFDYRDINANTVIEAEIEIEGRLFSLKVKTKGDSHCLDYSGCEPEFYRLIHLSEEETELSFYYQKEENTYSSRFIKYKSPDDYYPGRCFSMRTEGIGQTNTFRKNLRNCIRELEKTKLVEGKEYYIKASETGIVIPINGNDDVVCWEEYHNEFCESHGENILNKQVFLSSSDNAVFEYLCFLQLNELWKRIENMRSISYIGIPMIVMDFLDRIDEATDISKYIDKAKELNRQLVFTR